MLGVLACQHRSNCLILKIVWILLLIITVLSSDVQKGAWEVGGLRGGAGLRHPSDPDSGGADGGDLWCW